MQYEAAEKKYMNDLYKINSDMDNLDKNVRRYVWHSIAKKYWICINRNGYCTYAWNINRT